jgi:hypothetical protein
VSPSLIDQIVADGRTRRAIRINSRAVCDRLQLDEAFAALSDSGRDGNDPWSAVGV